LFAALVATALAAVVLAGDDGGFFEESQYLVRAHLPAYLRPVVAFSYITGWREHHQVRPMLSGRRTLTAEDADPLRLGQSPGQSGSAAVGAPLV